MENKRKIIGRTIGIDPNTGNFEMIPIYDTEFVSGEGVADYLIPDRGGRGEVDDMEAAFREASSAAIEEAIPLVSPVQKNKPGTLKHFLRTLFVPDDRNLW